MDDNTKKRLREIASLIDEQEDDLWIARRNVISCERAIAQLKAERWQLVLTQ